MSARIPLRFIVGDRTVVNGGLYDVVELFPAEHPLRGKARLRHVKAPGTMVIVQLEDLECVGFATTTVRAEEGR